MIGFDVNIHLPCHSPSLQEMLAEDLSMAEPELRECFSTHLAAIQKQTKAANFMLFNQALEVDHAAKFCEFVRGHMSGARFTLLVHPRARASLAKLKQYRAVGIDAIKFHCYIQEIETDDHPAAVATAVRASELGMPVFIDASYGSTKMYRYDNLRLAAAVLDEVANTPVVILHSGGARAMEAMLLAESCPNVFLDMSFSVPYYLDSPVGEQLAFAYKRVGAERVLYGSDFPYVSFEDSLSKTEAFLRRGNFSPSETEQIFGSTSQRLFQWAN
jgi:uncharacterized protein